jgi:hypothetical protein
MLSAGLLGFGCGDNGGGWDLDATDSTSETADTSDVAPDGPPLGRAVDILIVMQDSSSMGMAQGQMAGAYPGLVQGLLASTGHEPIHDLHIGVVSTDLGTGGYMVSSCPDPIDGGNGELLHVPNPAVGGCEATYPTYLFYEERTPDAARIDWVSTGIGCIATLGTDGCSWPQAFKAAGKALVDHRDGVNAGFLRYDSVLVVIFVSDQNECSVAPGSEGIFDVTDSSLGTMGLRCFNNPLMIQPLDMYSTLFSGLRTSPGDLLLAFVVGAAQDPACEGAGDAIGGCLDLPAMAEQIDTSTSHSLLPSCGSSSSPSATPARRYVELAQHFGAQAYVQSICDTDYSPTTGWIVERVLAIVGE